MPIKIDGTKYETDRDDLRLLFERDNPAGWIAQKLLADDHTTELTDDHSTAEQPSASA